MHVYVKRFNAESGHLLALTKVDVEVVDGKMRFPFVEQSFGLKHEYLFVVENEAGAVLHSQLVQPDGVGSWTRVVVEPDEWAPLNNGQ